MKTKLFTIIGAIGIVLIIGIGVVFALQQKKRDVPAPVDNEEQVLKDTSESVQEIDKKQNSEEITFLPTVLYDCGPRLVPVADVIAVDALLKSNNIDLGRLNRINPETSSILGYANKLTGYTFRVTEHRTENVFDGVLDRIIFDACYNGRLILTRNIRMSFINGKFRSAFDFDFIPILVNPNPDISLAEAKKIAYREQSTLSGTEPKLGYYDINASKGQVAPEYILAWEFRSGAHVVINAHTGEVVRSFNGIMY